MVLKNNSASFADNKFIPCWLAGLLAVAYGTVRYGTVRYGTVPVWFCFRFCFCFFFILLLFLILLVLSGPLLIQVYRLKYIASMSWLPAVVTVNRCCGNHRLAWRFRASSHICQLLHHSIKKMKGPMWGWSERSGVGWGWSFTETHAQSFSLKSTREQHGNKRT